ncbi:MAG: aldo/keto reductase [Candidatus Neomarinimicrobiota bacterium]
MRSLGNGGMTVSAIGLGCWAIGGVIWRDSKPSGWHGTNDEESIRAMQRALDLGVNFFDTADIYGCGHSERLIAKVIKGCRDRVVVATKFGFLFDEKQRTASGARYDRSYIYDACEASLRRLNTDYIDLYQFHINESKNGEEVRDVLESLVKVGKIRYYGWSTDNTENARVFAKGKHCVAIQQNLNVFGGNLEILRICEQYGLASINRGPLAKGLLTGKFTSKTSFPEDDIRHGWNLESGPQATQLKKIEAVRDILTSNGRTLAQGSLCWLLALSPSTIPIPGFKNIQQVEENLGALSFGPLSPEQVLEINNNISSSKHP